MQKKISNLPFKGTPEQEKQLMEIIASHKHDKSLPRVWTYRSKRFMV